MRILIVKKGAPEKLPFYPGFQYNDEATCISPSLWYLERGPDHHGKFRCNNVGTIKTNKGMLCGTHAKVYARRGWINANHLREILIAQAEEKAAKTKARLSCLRAGKCI